MIFYLGNKVENKLDEKIRLGKNKIKSWEYGYDLDNDIIVISKDGTLGSIFNINGINIGLPEPPSDRKKILNWDKTEKNQRWKREPLPSGLTAKTQYNQEHDEYITEEIRRRREGVWLFVNSQLVYMTGGSYFFSQWNKLDEGYPDFRIIQNELFIYWEACKADPRCYGIIYGKNRRFGWSSICNSENIDSGTTNENKEIGIISKTGEDGRKMFSRLVRTFKKLPAFFQPVWDGTTTPKKELLLSEPSRRKKRDDDDDDDFDEGLDTLIKYHSTVLNAMDGDKIFRSAIDEAAKFPADVPFDNYWRIVKTSHRQGKRIVGKAMVGSTVNSKKKGGREFEIVYMQSDPLIRNKNNQTASGLYSLFISAEYGLEGYYDTYGFSIVEDPIKPIKTDLNEYVVIGSRTHLDNELEALKIDPDAYNEQKRQFPRSIKDMFRDESVDCEFNLNKILEQSDQNKYELDEVYSGSETLGNKDIERGNFIWRNGVQDTEVIWQPNPEGRFWIKKGCHPPLEYRNKKEKKFKNGILAFAPIGDHIGAFGVDPYNRDKSADGRGSMGAIHLSTTTNTSTLPNDQFILEYIARAKKVTIFFEEVLMAMVYYSIPMLSELSNEAFLQYVVDRGYRHYSLNNPFKPYLALSHTEKKLGGAPPQNAKIADQQFYAIESYIEDHVGVANDNRCRKKGFMGEMPFSRTLAQWKDVDLTDRTKYDAYISSSLSRLGCQRRVHKTETANIITRNPFKQYNNKGQISEGA